MATAYLLELIIQMTAAKTDQEHLSAVVLNNPQVPDRTAYILDRERPSPLPVLEGMAHAVGAGLITGLEGNILDPGGTATRAQLAVILQRLLIPAVG